MSGRPAHGAEASSSHAALPASGGPAARLEQQREHVDAPPAHFASAQAEEVLWQEFCDHGASLNRALNEVLRIHGGPAWRIFQVCDLSPGFVVFPLYFFRVRAPLDPCLLLPCPSVAGFGVSGPGEVRHYRPPECRAQLVPGQYNTLDALVEALRTPDQWLVYRAEALRDQPPELDA
jgi:hypothetical protein